jgi:hypothetical protein
MASTSELLDRFVDLFKNAERFDEVEQEYARQLRVSGASPGSGALRPPTTSTPDNAALHHHRMSML